MPTTATIADSPALPAPDERPEADVVIFDGQCSFCTAGVRRIHRRDKGGRLAYLSLHDAEVARRFPELRHADLMEDMHVVDRRAAVYRGAAAFRYLTRRLPQLWWLAPLLHVPGSLPFWQWCYRQIAKRRYLFGRTTQCASGTCRLHDHR